MAAGISYSGDLTFPKLKMADKSRAPCLGFGKVLLQPLWFSALLGSFFTSTS